MNDHHDITPDSGYGSRFSPKARPLPAVDLTEPPVTECPSWCRASTPDHGWTGLTHEDALVRDHSIDVGSIGGETLRSSGYSDASASVDIVAEERRAGGRAGEVVLGQPRIALWAEYVLLDASRARAVAALLLTAAARLDKIVGA